MADSARITIGKVVERLKPRYPDLSISKVRYLEDEGLLTPMRTASGYRLYSQKDVDRLERILYLQKNRFLPLAVIKEMLDRDDPGAMTATEGESERDQLLESEDVTGRLHPIDKMPDQLGVPISFVRQLADAGLIELKRSPGGRDLVDGKDLALIRTADQLRRFGIEPKNLRQYVTAANRESAMFEQALAIYGNRGEPTPEQREQFAQSFDSMLTLTNKLRTQLIRKTVTGHFKGMA